jgi:hypothetical protein
VTLDDIRLRWAKRRDEWRRLGVYVDGGTLCDEILADLEALDASGETLLTLVDAAAESGYSADHLGRLVRDGVIPNAGRANAPKIRRRDLPRKPLPAAHDAAIVARDRRRIAAAVLTLDARRQDD